jgi:peptidoglycan/LPS O-acetylase OafA/YrhL
MAVGIAWLVGTQVALYFSIWLMGALIRFCPPLLRSDASALRKTLQLMTFTTTIAIVLGSRIWANEPGWDFAIGGSFAAWVYLKLHDDSRARAGAITWIARLLAGCSFTLYVIHFPVLVMIDSFVVGSGRWQPTSLRMTWLLLITFGIFLFAVGWAMLTEANTSVVRRWLRLNSDRRPDQAN